MDTTVLKNPPPRRIEDVRPFASRNIKLSKLLLGVAVVTFFIALGRFYFKTGVEALFPAGFIIAAIVAAIPAFFAWGTRKIAAQSVEFLRTAIYAEGRVTAAISNSAGLTVEVDYTDRAGHSWSGQAVVLGSPEENKEGESIAVLYDPNNSAQFVVLTAGGLAPGKSSKGGIGKVRRLLTNPWMAIGLICGLMALFAGTFTFISSQREIIDADLNRPETVEAARVKGLFPGLRGKVVRVGPHLLLYPLSVYEYKKDESNPSTEPTEDTRLSNALYVPVISQDHPMGKLIMQIPPNEKGERILDPGFIALLSQTEIHFIIPDGRRNFVRDIPKGVLAAPGFVSDPTTQLGNSSERTKQIRSQLKNSPGDLTILDKSEGSYAFAVILTIMSAGSLLLGLNREKKAALKAAALKDGL